MRYREFKLTEQQLEELKMSPRSLGSFAKSPVAKGIKAGFEAEMIFPGMAGEGEYEPDYDEDTRPSSIDEVIEFFSYDGSGFGIGRSEANRLRSSLEEEFWEYNDEKMMSEFQDQAFTLVRDYIETHDFDFEEAVQEYLKDEAELSDEEIEQVTTAAQNATSSKDTPAVYRAATDAAAQKLDELAEESISNQDGTYDNVLDEFRDDYDQSENESDWLSENYRYMSDIESAFGLSWPYWRGSDNSEGYNEDNAEQLADDLSNALGVKTRASGGYHSAKRDDVTWIFEPDGSLSADVDEDMPVEIVSPPMDLEDCLTKLDKFFAWADTHNAYTNKSTGFHMGVSLPNVGGNVDFVKLALFLGDEHVLQAFGRQAVGYCEAAMKKIRQRMKGREESVESALTLMREGLIDAARKLIASDEGFGKYTSINPKGNYIEFRSAGGEDYSKDIPKLKNTLLRYAQAMVVAADPQLERKEYYKKFYKLISPKGGNSALDLFARFASGTISKEELKNQWAKTTLEKEAPELLKKSNWKVVIKSSGEPLTGYEFKGFTRDEAYAAVKDKMSPGSSQRDFDLSFNRNYELRDIGTNTGKWNIIDKKTNKILDTIDAPTRGEAADVAREKYLAYDYYIEPAAQESKPLSRRAELAKRITKPAPSGPQKFQLIHDATGEVKSEFEASSKEAADNHANAWLLRTYGKFLKDGGYTVKQVKSTQSAEPRHPQQVRSPNGVPMWEIYNRVTGLGLHQFADHTQNLAWQTAQQWAQEQGFADRMDVLSVRPVMPQD